MNSMIALAGWLRSAFVGCVEHRGRRLLVLASVVALVTAATPAGVVSLSTGPQPDGTSVTPQGWRVTPAGRQTDLGSGPLDIAVSPAGGIALVANAGYGNHTLMVVDTATGDVVQTIKTQSNALRAEKNRVIGRVYAHFYYYGGQHGFYSGLAFSPDGSRAYAADGPGSAIHVFTVVGKMLVEEQEIGIKGDVWPAGIAVSPDGARLFVAANLADQLYVVDVAKRKVLGSVTVGHLPLAVALDHAGTTAYVSSWGGTTVVPVNVVSMTASQPIEVGSHPSALALNPRSDELYVADTDSDMITVIDTALGNVVRTFSDRPFDGAGIGASPNGLAVSPDGTTLYVANAGNNDVAVFTLARGTNTDAPSGLIPGHTDLDYSGWDLSLPDQARIDEWLREFAGYVASGDLPAVEFVYLPRDHTMNTASGQPAPTAMVADNDLALGRLVEAVSHSVFWRETAILVVEDDAQDGPDHVEMHRTVAQVISPYSQTGAVDSTFYSTVSMLRTIELIAGIPPLTQFDAAATPMSRSFSSTPRFDRYDAITPMTSLTATNSASAPMATLAATWDYSVPDRVPKRLANLALWTSLKGGQAIPRSMRQASKRED
jgi:YVTN family beta-propeller protein